MDRFIPQTSRFPIPYSKIKDKAQKNDEETRDKSDITQLQNKANVEKIENLWEVQPKDDKLVIQQKWFNFRKVQGWNMSLEKYEIILESLKNFINDDAHGWEVPRDKPSWRKFRYLKYAVVPEKLRDLLPSPDWKEMLVVPVKYGYEFQKEKKYYKWTNLCRANMTFWILDNLNKNFTHWRGSSERMWMEVSNYFVGISLGDCIKWVSTSPVHVIHSKGLNQEQPPYWKPITPAGPHRHFQLDISYMQAYKNYNLQYILFMTDIWTKKAWAWALSNRTAQTVWNHAKSVLEQEWEIARVGHGLKPEQFAIQTDEGGEFEGEFTDEIKSRGWDKRTGFPGHSWSQGAVERLGRTIKALLFSHMTNYSNRQWYRNLGTAMENYNDTWHSTIKMKPIEAHEWTLDSSTDICKKTISWVNKCFQDRMDKWRAKFKDIPNPFKVGDIVRLLLSDIRAAPERKNIFYKKYRGTWSRDVYVITKIQDEEPLPQITVRKLKVDPTSGIFYKDPGSAPVRVFGSRLKKQIIMGKDSNRPITEGEVPADTSNTDKLKQLTGTRDPATVVKTNREGKIVIDLEGADVPVLENKKIQPSIDEREQGTFLSFDAVSLVINSLERLTSSSGWEYHIMLNGYTQNAKNESALVIIERYPRYNNYELLDPVESKGAHRNMGDFFQSLPFTISKALDVKKNVRFIFISTVVYSGSGINEQNGHYTSVGVGIFPKRILDNDNDEGPSMFIFALDSMDKHGWLQNHTLEKAKDVCPVLRKVDILGNKIHYISTGMQLGIYRLQDPITEEERELTIDETGNLASSCGILATLQAWMLGEISFNGWLVKKPGNLQQIIEKHMIKMTRNERIHPLVGNLRKKLSPDAVKDLMAGQDIENTAWHNKIIEEIRKQSQIDLNYQSEEGIAMRKFWGDSGQSYIDPYLPSTSKKEEEEEEVVDLVSPYGSPTHPPVEELSPVTLSRSKRKVKKPARYLD